MKRFFSPTQMSLASRTFSEAERLAGAYFRLSAAEWRLQRYDVKTRAYLEDHEVQEGTFAHLCRYEYRQEPEKTDANRHFYRICLQDEGILDAVERAHSFIRLSPLLLYIAAHELVHVIRFERGEGNFEADGEEKTGEEETVHRITRNLLRPATNGELNLVLDCFSNDYRIGDFVRS